MLCLCICLRIHAEIVFSDDTKCSKLSANYKGWCLKPVQCVDVCEKEKEDYYTGGACRGFPPRCYCIFVCPLALEAKPVRNQLDGNARRHD